MRLDGYRKKKAVHKVSTTDDKRLQATLKRLGVNTIPGIEEVNLFVENDVIHFTNPKGDRHSSVLSPTGLFACTFVYILTACHTAQVDDIFGCGAQVSLCLTCSAVTPQRVKMSDTWVLTVCSASLHCSQHLRCQRTLTDKE